MRTKNPIKKLAPIAAILALATSLQLTAQTTPTPGSPDPMLAKIREEGLQRSQVLQTLSYLTDVIGPRLTGSPNLKRANEWSRDQLTKFGLENAHLEAWPFNGRGWVLKRFTMQVTQPQQISIIAYPKAWSEGLDKPITAPVVLLEARTEADLEKYRGKLKGAIVLNGGTRAVGPSFSPLAARLTDKELERLASAAPGQNIDTAPQRTPQLPGRRGPATASAPATDGATTTAATSTPATASAPAAGGGRGGRGGGAPALARGRILSFLMEEGAAIELSMTSGNEMAIIVGAGQAALPSAAGAAPGGRGGANAYAMTAPKSIPQVTVSIEHYNRLVRMAQQNVPITMEADLQVQYVTEDPNAYNTIAEIPGTDLKDEIVMLGAHIDSWHMGDGATDNGTGVAECMEAVRIIKALGIKPRRTIRVGLWSGEEEGLLGSRAYVRQHFGALPGNLIGGRGGRGGGGRGGAETEPAAASAPATTSAPATRVGLLPDAAKFSCYFNTDEGGGRFRGVYASDNSAAAEIMRQYLAPVKDLGPSVVSPGHATGSDHQSFESAGLPAFQFMPDPIDYWAGTWHTSQDLYDHVVPDDIKAASVVMATCVYQAAMADEKMPRRQ